MACLGVVLHHVGMYLQRGFFTGWNPLFADADGLVEYGVVLLSQLGFQGVSLFLVLSGFCLYLPIARRPQVPIALRPWGLARARRILPAYYASLALLWMVSISGPTGRWAVFQPIVPLDVAIHALLLHNLVPELVWTINGVYWTLALEAQLYVVFPLLVLSGRRVGMTATAAMLVLLSVVWPAVMSSVAPALEGGAWVVAFEGVPARAGEFAAGMAAAAVVARGVPVWLRRAAVPLSFAWLPASYVVHSSRTVSFPIDKPICAIAFAALVVVVATADARQPSLPLRVLSRVGQVSFSLYLIHQPILLSLRPWFDRQGWSYGVGWAMSLGLGMPLLVVCAAVFYRAFEAPFLVATRRPGPSH